MNSKKTILIVDDEPTTLDLFEGFLFAEGYHLIFAESGPETLARLEEIAPDVILLDVMMPEMDGFEVCRRLKADERWRYIPIILVTALGSTEDLVEGLGAGGDDFLHKPVDKLELQARVRSMLRIKQQYDELQSTLRLREDMARMITHDMRAPLNIILGYSELLQIRGAVTADDLRNVKNIQAEAYRLNSFLNDMLMLAKMEAGQPILNPSPVDVRHLVKQVVQGHDMLARSREVKLVSDLPANASPMLLDANLFQRLLDNLLANALKFSPPQSTVTVQVEFFDAAAVEMRLRLKVVDEGPGIAAEYHDRIFDKFQVVDLKEKGVPQVGLGLTLCKMVAEAHGGCIFVESNQPVGAIFVVEI